MQHKGKQKLIVRAVQSLNSTFSRLHISLHSPPPLIFYLSFKKIVHSFSCYETYMDFSWDEQIYHLTETDLAS